MAERELDMSNSDSDEDEVSSFYEYEESSEAEDEESEDNSEVLVPLKFPDGFVRHVQFPRLLRTQDVCSRARYLPCMLPGHGQFTISLQTGQPRCAAKLCVLDEHRDACLGMEYMGYRVFNGELQLCFSDPLEALQLVYLESVFLNPLHRVCDWYTGDGQRLNLKWVPRFEAFKGGGKVHIGRLWEPIQLQTNGFSLNALDVIFTDAVADQGKVRKGPICGKCSELVKDTFNFCTFCANRLKDGDGDADFLINQTRSHPMTPDQKRSLETDTDDARSDASQDSARTVDEEEMGGSMIVFNPPVFCNGTAEWRLHLGHRSAQSKFFFGLVSASQLNRMYRQDLNPDYSSLPVLCIGAVGGWESAEELLWACQDHLFWSRRAAASKDFPGKLFDLVPAPHQYEEDDSIDLRYNAGKVCITHHSRWEPDRVVNLTLADYFTFGPGTEDTFIHGNGTDDMFCFLHRHVEDYWETGRDRFIVDRVA